MAKTVYLAYNGGGDDSFPALRILRIQRRQTSRLTSHPVESGGIIFDNRVRQPKTFSVTGVLEGEKVFETLSLLKDSAEAHTAGDGSMMWLTLHGINFRVKNLAITSFSYTESNEKFDVYDVVLDISEVLLTSTRGTRTRNDASDY